MNKENIKNLSKPYLIAWSTWRIRAATSPPPFLFFKEKIGLAFCARKGDMTPPKQNLVSSHEAINPVISKSIHQAESILSTSAVVSQSECVHATLLPTIKETKVPNTRHTKHHYTVKRETGNFKYSDKNRTKNSSTWTAKSYE